MTKTTSPCIRNCCLDQSDICMGCFRSLQEIKEWGQASDIRKQEINVLCLQREENERRLREQRKKDYDRIK
ncbi:DUF1289 domain-containing protein [Psychromonas ossibalaenae]|uniref:DUF1289 domain-containing protein n=1 Tax=Psychromonas ossibalaenae TaxID=444922 RepID=UPI000366009E|nr:DUF1289 domain-containing protein [Psychromonas ossibalaenae]